MTIDEAFGLSIAVLAVLVYFGGMWLVRRAENRRLHRTALNLECVKLGLPVDASMTNEDVQRRIFNAISTMKPSNTNDPWPEIEKRINAQGSNWGRN